jgi:putative toxin-antitoxin system antitoxin component (TIGR02293 family)
MTTKRNQVVFDRVLLYAEQIFQDAEKAQQWLNRSNGSLGNKAPIEIMGTEKGCNEVLEILGRIDYGIYS